MYIFMYIVSHYNVKDVHYSFSKNIHLHNINYISGSWRREEGAAAPMIKKVFIRGTLKSAIKTASATALFYLEKGESLCPKRRFPDI